LLKRKNVLRVYDAIPPYCGKIFRNDSGQFQDFRQQFS
jgi:hypothetical protein